MSSFEVFVYIGLGLFVAVSFANLFIGRILYDKKRLGDSKGKYIDFSKHSLRVIRKEKGFRKI